MNNKKELFKHIMKNTVAPLEVWKQKHKETGLMLAFEIWSEIFLVRINKNRFLTKLGK